MGKKEKDPVKNKLGEGYLIVVSLIKTFGPATAFILICSSFIQWYATDEQKRELIDSWILLKNERHYFCVIIILTLIIVLALLVIYYTKALRFYEKKLKV